MFEFVHIYPKIWVKTTTFLRVYSRELEISMYLVFGAKIPPKATNIPYLKGGVKLSCAFNFLIYSHNCQAEI